MLETISEFIVSGSMFTAFKSDFKTVVAVNGNKVTEMWMEHKFLSLLNLKEIYVASASALSNNIFHLT